MALSKKEKQAEWRKEYVQTVRGRALKLINNARSRSVDKGIYIDLPLSWLEEKLLKNSCEITNMPFDLSPPEDHTRRYNAPSLDRIDKTKGYTVDNTRLVLWVVNCALAEYGTDIILPILKAMVAGIENAKPNTTPPVPTRLDKPRQINPQCWSVPATGSGQDNNDADDYRGATQGKNAYRSAKEGGGNCMGSGGK
jgi:hypothetical protein